MRTGLVGKKVGMTRLFDEFGQHVPVTVIDVSGCVVVGKRTEDKDGYNALMIGYGKANVKRLAKSQKEKFAKAGVEARAKTVEFRVANDAMVDVGSEILANHFVDGQYIDVSGTSIGKGFAGAMKRHNFRGLEASHGVSISHRSHGSTGGRQDPGKVFKNKKMAGHMGQVRVTTQNLQLVQSDAERGLLFVKGAVPGSKGDYVFVSDAVKRMPPADVPFPASVKKSASAESNKASEPAAEGVEQSESSQG